MFAIQLDPFVLKIRSNKLGKREISRAEQMSFVLWRVILQRTLNPKRPV